MNTYSITNWNNLYENSRSRQIKDIDWVPVPNRHDGEGFALVMMGKDAAEIYAAWHLILQVASRCHPRGTLVRDDGTALTPRSLAVKTRGKEAWFEKAFAFLSDPEIGWLTCSESTPLQQGVTVVSPECQEGSNEGKGIEGKGIEEKKKNVVAKAPSAPRKKKLPEEVEEWNKIEGVRHVKEMTAARTKALSDRRKDNFFSRHWKEGLRVISNSKFCRGENERGWVADIDFFLRPGSLVKVMEGKYSNQAAKRGGMPNPGFGNF